MDMDVLQLLFFAGLAVFLGVRLYMLLGKPSGRTHEEHMREERERARAAGREPRPADPHAEPAPAAAPAGPAFSGPAAAGLTAIAGQDPSFDPDMFAKGARQAYDMIVQAYAAGDKEALETLLSEKVMKAWGASIDARAEAGQTLVTEIERLKKAEIVEASLNDNRARVKVAFSAEIASETRDADGAVIEGDINTLKTVEEVWSFERDVTSRNPNWRLAGVRAA
ncbi:Tim44 domain-containing protein [Alkalicaulis satelles]|uniref:Tim44 domain-containing protein n=1 Tax=Alkalicaulis satelles TaxID=2609175 RepID=A0A5M6ZHP5_9PROT|nr:Tim44/TimA family putative adaptor protein [Alkalicaulis satelles]KAA5803820.1 Tim44 domain-containing protein [Alkalicaulis satelles]